MMLESNAHPNLQKQLAEMRRVRASMEAYDPAVPHPPLLDSSFDPGASTSQSPIPGLRALLESVSRDIEVIEQVLASYIL